MRRRKLFTGGIKRSKSKSMFNGPDVDYGLALPLDDVMSSDELQKKKMLFLDKLKTVDKKQLEFITREQSCSQDWFLERKKRLTASNFGDICKMRATTSCRKKVHNMLYKPNTVCKEMSYGIQMESSARNEFEKLSKKSVKSCGLFTDDTFPYLAASPGMWFIFIYYF